VVELSPVLEIRTYRLEALAAAMPADRVQ